MLEYFLSPAKADLLPTDKTTNNGYIYRVHPNKSSLKILVKRERGSIRDCPYFWT